MKTSSTREVWVTAKDAAFESGECGGIKSSPNLSVPKDAKKFAKTCNEDNKGARFVAELTRDGGIFCGVVPDGTTPRRALKKGDGLVWGLTREMLGEMIDLLQKIEEDYENQSSGD